MWNSDASEIVLARFCVRHESLNGLAEEKAAWKEATELVDVKKTPNAFVFSRLYTYTQFYDSITEVMVQSIGTCFIAIIAISSVVLQSFSK